MSISKCMTCQNYRRPTQKGRTLFPADCIGCASQYWQQQIKTPEEWQEICLTPYKVDHQDSATDLWSSKHTDRPRVNIETQYLQVGYQQSKNHSGTKLFHVIKNIRRRKKSAAPSTDSNKSQELSECSSLSGGETNENRITVESPGEYDAEFQSSEKEQKTVSNIIEENVLNNYDHETIISVLSREKGFEEATESGVDVLALMRCSENRAVSLAAEAAAHAAASVLAVPTARANTRDAQQLSYTSVMAIPENAEFRSVGEIHDVLHSVRSALEHRQRLHRCDAPATASVDSQTRRVRRSEVATCTTPPTSNPNAAVKPFLCTLRKMYEKHLYISALLHNLTSLDLKKLGYRVDECSSKLQVLQDVCSQLKIVPVTADMAVGIEETQKPITIDAAVGEIFCGPEMVDAAVGQIFGEPEKVDAAVGEKEIRDQKTDKETQDFVEKLVTIDEFTEPTNFGVENGVQVARDEWLGKTEVSEIGIQTRDEGLLLSGVDNEDPWKRLSQVSDLSSSDIHSLNYCNPHLFEAYISQFENTFRSENGPLDTRITPPESFNDVKDDFAGKPQNRSKQKYRVCKPMKVSTRPVIHRSPNKDQSPGRSRLTLQQQLHRSPQHLSGASKSEIPGKIETQSSNSKYASATSTRFAGGRSGVNRFPMGRGLAGNKSNPLSFVSTKWR